MQVKFGERLDVKIYTMDSEEAKGYTFMSSTNVLFDNEWVPLEEATDKSKMEAFLSSKV
jgi:hypothetical protein